MERRKFILTTLATSLTPLAGLPAYGAPDKKGFKVKPGEGRLHGHIQLTGVNANILDVKVSGKDTDGQLAIFEQTSVSPKRGTPLHIHPFQDEVFCVLEGEYYFQVGAEKFSLKTGEYVFLPRKVPHSWIQVSPTGRMTITLQPAGKLEEFFLAMAALKTPPTPEEVARIFAAHDMQVVGPPVSMD